MQTKHATYSLAPTLTSQRWLLDSSTGKAGVEEKTAFSSPLSVRIALTTAHQRCTSNAGFTKFSHVACMLTPNKSSVKWGADAIKHLRKCESVRVKPPPLPQISLCAADAAITLEQHRQSPSATSRQRSPGGGANANPQVCKVQRLYRQTFFALSKCCYRC